MEVQGSTDVRPQGELYQWLRQGALGAGLLLQSVGRTSSILSFHGLASLAAHRAAATSQSSHSLEGPPEGTPRLNPSGITEF